MHADAEANKLHHWVCDGCGDTFQRSKDWQPQVNDCRHHGSLKGEPCNDSGCHYHAHLKRCPRGKHIKVKEPQSFAEKAAARKRKAEEKRGSTASSNGANRGAAGAGAGAEKIAAGTARPRGRIQRRRLLAEAAAQRMGQQAPSPAPTVAHPGPTAAPGFGPGSPQSSVRRLHSTESGNQGKARSLVHPGVIDIDGDDEETTSEEKPLLQKPIDLTVDDESPQTRGPQGVGTVRLKKHLGVSGVSGSRSRKEADELNMEDSDKMKQREDKGEGQEGPGQECGVCLLAGGDTPPLLSEVCPICEWNEGRSQAEVDAHIDCCIRKEVVYM